MSQIEPPFIDLHAATWTDQDTYVLADGAKRFENWESFVAGRIGLAKAVEYAQSVGLDAIEERITALARSLRTKLSECPGVTLHDRGARQCGIVTFDVAGESPSNTAARLAKKAINVSVSLRTSAQIDLGRRGLEALTRASVHYFNTDDEIDRVVEAVAQTT